jgi:hypothetical protein
MANSPKKVLVRRFTGDTLPGYLPQSSFVRNNAIDLLDLSGHLIPLSLDEIKTISYVRDFNLADAVNPERLTCRTFLARPRTEGLWLRLPPDTRSNTQRLYVPRSALTDVQLLAVITTPSRRQPLPAPTERENRQDELFHLPIDPASRPN